MNNKNGHKHVVALVDSNGSIVRVHNTNSKEDAVTKAVLWVTLFRYSTVLLDNEKF